MLKIKVRFTYRSAHAYITARTHIRTHTNIAQVYKVSNCNMLLMIAGSIAMEAIINRFTTKQSKRPHCTKTELKKTNPDHFTCSVKFELLVAYRGHYFRGGGGRIYM